VKIDGRGPYRFVIDTAASGTAVLPKLRATLATSLQPDAPAPLDGVSGRAQIETVRLPRLTADGRTFRNLRAVALPVSSVDKLGVDGILGADVVANYVLEMNMAGRTWRMAESLEPSAYRRMHAPVPIELTAGKAPKLQVRVDGVEMPAILDTGARGTMMNWAAARALGLTPDSPTLKPSDAVKGATSHATPSMSAKFGMLAIGEAHFPDRSIRIADLPVFAALGMAEGPAMILGMDAFRDRRFIVDHPSKKLFISPPGPVK
jgi:predicted aspartyl protease